jgi:cytosine/adenosine deaminase-related metal-dependent hydrolase
MDATALRSAYEELFAEAEAGGFGLPPAGEWTAELVLAHIAANDELLTAATEAVLADDPQAYHVDEAVSSARRASAASSRGDDLAGLIGWARSTSMRLCELAERLGERDNTWVHTHIQDGDETIVDQPLPWARTLDIHAKVHLPLHVDQLRALRTA